MTMHEFLDETIKRLADPEIPFSYRKAGDSLGFSCAYRGENGAKCAIGARIPDHIYDPEWDKMNLPVSGLPLEAIESLDIEKFGFPADMSMSYMHILREIQRLHDDLAEAYDDLFLSRGALNQSWEAAWKKFDDDSDAIRTRIDEALVSGFYRF